MDEFDAQYADYVSAQDFPQMEAYAASRGFRKATAAEVRSSANKNAWAEDLYCWRGGLWVRYEPAIKASAATWRPPGS